MQNVRENGEEEGKVTSLRPRARTVDEIEPGALLADGVEVAEVIAKLPGRYVIYRIKGESGISYRWQDIPLETQHAIREIEKVAAKAVSKHGGIGDSFFDAAYLSAIRAAFDTEDATASDRIVGELEKEVGNVRTVRAVFANTTNYRVWLDENHSVRYEYNGPIIGLESALAEYSRLRALATVTLREANLRHFTHRMGIALAAVFHADSCAERHEALKPLDTYLSQFVSNNLRVKYLGATTSVAIILLSISYLLYLYASLPAFLHTALIATSGGYVGTFISLLERSKTLVVSDNESINLVVLQGALRVLLGGVFGLIAFAAAEAGLAFSVFKDAPSALLLLGAAAGFSERLVPDLIQGLSSGSERDMK